AQKCPLLKGVKRAEVTRHYSGNYTIVFDPKPKTAPVSRAELREAIEEAIPELQDLTAPEGKGGILGNIKQACLSALQNVVSNAAGDGEAPKSLVDQAVNAIAAHANEDWQKKLLDPVASPFKEMAKRTAAVEKLGEARLWLQLHL